MEGPEGTDQGFRRGRSPASRVGVLSPPGARADSRLQHLFLPASGLLAWALESVCLSLAPSASLSPAQSSPQAGAGAWLGSPLTPHSCLGILSWLALCVPHVLPTARAVAGHHSGPSQGGPAGPGQRRAHGADRCTQSCSGLGRRTARRVTLVSAAGLASSPTPRALHLEGAHRLARRGLRDPIPGSGSLCQSREERWLCALLLCQT